MAIQLFDQDGHLSTMVTNFPNRSAPLSLTVWVKSWRWGNDVASMAGLYLQGTTGIQIGTRTTTGITIWNWGGAITITSDGIFAPTNGEWLHIGYTWDGSTHKLYANGNYITSSTTSVPSGVLTRLYLNGYPGGGSTECSDSIIDDLGYFNRTLTDDEVMTMYQSRGSKAGIITGAIARYQFNSLPVGEYVDYAVDYTGNNNILYPEGSYSYPPIHVEGIIDSDIRAVLG